MFGKTCEKAARRLSISPAGRSEKRAADVFALLGGQGVLLPDRNIVQHRSGGLGDGIRQCSVLCFLGVLPNGVRLVLTALLSTYSVS